jgi:hypothetical protein
MPGPLPDPKRRRRNAPTIPTTELPVAGRKGPAPKPPTELARAGKAWWRWAWRLPQACGWSAGDLYVVARRAELEDSLEALELVDGFDLAELLDDDDAARRLEAIIGKLKALAGGRLALEREMRELDDRLGLTPKGLAALRWKIVADAELELEDDDEPAGDVTRLEDRRRRLTGA